MPCAPAKSAQASILPSGAVALPSASNTRSGVHPNFPAATSRIDCNNLAAAPRMAEPPITIEREL